MARIHRDGPKKDCFFYRFHMAGGIDKKIWQRQIVKPELANNIMNQREETSSFTEEDLHDLFRLDEKSSCQTHELIGCSCGGNGADFVDIDRYDDAEALHNMPAFVAGVVEKTKKPVHAIRDALMAYTHADTSGFADGSNEENEVLIRDEVLLKTLKDNIVCVLQDICVIEKL